MAWHAEQTRIGDETCEYAADSYPQSKRTKRNYDPNSNGEIRLRHFYASEECRDAYAETTTEQYAYSAALPQSSINNLGGREEERAGGGEVYQVQENAVTPGAVHVKNLVLDNLKI